MNGRAECSRGWAKRCKASKGERCKCACGGKNHGGKGDQIDILDAIEEVEQELTNDATGAR
jgi:hypothetical protein